MKIDKAKLSKALKKIGIFVGKNQVSEKVSLVHFRNENGKAMVFATDLASAGRTYFDTDEQGLFEFCIEYSQLLQATRMRSKEINAEFYKDRILDNGESSSGIEFYDENTRFSWAAKDNGSLDVIEKASVVPEGVPVEITGKEFKSAITCSGYARDEKNTQTPYIMGVHFVSKGKSVDMHSTDRQRIAGWRNSVTEDLGLPDNSECVEGTMSPRNVQSVGLFDDDEVIKVYITDSQIVLISDTLEAYATKINTQYPSIKGFFEKTVFASTNVKCSDVMESLNIVDGIKAKFINLKFTADKVFVSGTGSMGEKFEDSFPCERISGDDIDISVDSNYFKDIFSHVHDDAMTLEFRKQSETMTILSYKTDEGAYGILAPQRR